jgi:hypothetical protein
LFARPSLLKEELDRADRGELSMNEMRDLSERLKLLGEIHKLHREIEAPEPSALPAHPSAPPEAAPPTPVQTPS